MAGEPTHDPKATVPKATPGQQPKKSKKKHAPDRPQPAWLFPTDEENPVLNPKAVSEKDKQKANDDRLAAIKFLKHKAVTAPMTTAPPTLLLTLVGAFLASIGFVSTGRIYTLERNARTKLEGWDDEVGRKLEKDMPDLVKIYKDWFAQWQEGRNPDVTSSDDEDDAAAEQVKEKKTSKKVKKVKKAKNKAVAHTSSSESDESSNDQISKAKSRSGLPSKLIRKANSSQPHVQSSSTSTSESDADDENDAHTGSPKMKPALTVSATSLKRKSSSSGNSSTSSSESGSDVATSSSDAPARKKKKIAKSATSDVTPAPSQKSGRGTHKKLEKLPAEVPSSSSSEESSAADDDSDVSMVDEQKGPITRPVNLSIETIKTQTNGRKSSTDSSATLKGPSPTKPTASERRDKDPSSDSSSTSSSSSSDSEVLPPEPTSSTPAKPTKRKRSASPAPKTESNINAPSIKVAKKQNVPFSRIGTDVKVDPKLASNAYRPYDYADRAHKDLSVTKGKGFTKEKNKKKRGS